MRKLILICLTMYFIQLVRGSGYRYIWRPFIQDIPPPTPPLPPTTEAPTTTTTTTTLPPTTEASPGCVTSPEGPKKNGPESEAMKSTPFPMDNPFAQFPSTFKGFPPSSKISLVPLQRYKSGGISIPLAALQGYKSGGSNGITYISFPVPSGAARGDLADLGSATPWAVNGNTIKGLQIPAGAIIGNQIIVPSGKGYSPVRNIQAVSPKGGFIVQSGPSMWSNGPKAGLRFIAV